MVFYYFFSKNAFDINIKIQEHAFITYSKYTKYQKQSNQKTKELSQDELNNHQEINTDLSILTSV